MLTRKVVQTTALEQLKIPQYTTNVISFPFNNFKYYLTLFSKFFSSFPHGTCSLSVSCLYLALEGIYLPFRAALPSNPTRWYTAVRSELQTKNRVITFHDLIFQSSSVWATTDTYSIDYNSIHPGVYRFTNWALPASLAVTEGILVSFFSSA